MSERLTYAKWFVEHGFAVFPVDPQSKKPVVSAWQKYSTTPLSNEEKEKYLKMIEQGYNYAVPGGQQNLIILDFEDKELLREWIGEDMDRFCHQTLCVSTPHGGLHVYFVSDDVPPHKFNPLFKKDNKTVADLQSFNSYVVGPGSCINHKHCSYDKCPWRGQDHVSCYSLISELQIGKNDSLKDYLKYMGARGKAKQGIEISSSAREWLESGKDLDGEEPKNGGEPKNEEPKNGGEPKKGEDRKWVEELKNELIKRDSGKSVEQVKEEICKNPPQFVRAIICEGKSYGEVNVNNRSSADFRIVLYLMKRGVTDPDKILQFLPNDSKVKNNEKWSTEMYYAVTLKNAWKMTQKHLEMKRNVKGNKSKAKGLLIETLADEIMYEYELANFIQTNDQLKESEIGLFKFNVLKGIFEPFEKRIEKVINEKLEEYQEFPLGMDKTRVVRNVKEEIMRRTQKQFLTEPLRIAFKNGTWEWKDQGATWYDINERTPDQYAFHYIDWVLKIDEVEKFFNGKEITVQDIEDLARRLCPGSLKAFKDWVDEKWVLLFEILGYTLYPRYIFNKAILLIGEGANGKSTFLNLLLKILGHKNVSGMPLKRIMEGDRFASIELFHKLANISSELFAFKVSNTDLFKKLTGEDYIEGQKKFKDPIFFVNYAKLLNATNELPVVSDQTHGFWRRWIVIEFPHQFPPDPGFFDRTFTQDEVEGVLAVSLVAFGRVLQHKKFDFEDSSADIREMWERKTDSVYAFMKEMIESGAEYNPKDGDVYTPADEFYKAYMDWCNENDVVKPETKAVVTQRLESKFRISKDRKTIGGKKVMCYVGIRLKTEGPEESTVGGNGSNDLPDLINQYKGKTVNVNDLLSQLKLRTYELLDFCSKRNMCHWLDKENVKF